MVNQSISWLSYASMNYNYRRLEFFTTQFEVSTWSTGDKTRQEFASWVLVTYGNVIIVYIFFLW